MSFQEKSTVAMLTVILVVFGWYFVLVLGAVAESPAREVAYKGLMIPAVALLVILSVAAHVIIAVTDPVHAGTSDERDRLIALRGERLAGYVLAAGVFAGLAFAMAEVATFWIAQVLLGALVLAELTEGGAKLVLYRRGT